MIEVYDNIIDRDFIENYEAMHINPYFAWFLSSNTYGTVDDDIAENIECPHTKIVDGPQFVHTFVKDEQDNSDRALYARDLLRIACDSIGLKPTPFRIKSNLCPLSFSNNKDEHQVPHVDFIDNHYGAIYYVNDSDGPTFFFDKDYKVIKTVDPKKGRFVFFDGEIFHAGSHPNKNNFRIVTNFNFRI